jgi:putative CRISPR-associated protein (TIGR02619 family)
MTCGTSLIKNAVRENGSSENIARWLKSKDIRDRSCGAEINGLACMMEELPGLVDPKEVVLYVSDTEEGSLVGKTLAVVIHEKFNIPRVRSICVEGLDPGNPAIFRRRGLKNFVMRLADDVKAKGRFRCIINATGGFKIEVGLAQELASAVGVPSYYKFEFSSEGMLFPPLPVGLDIGLWLRLNKEIECLGEDLLTERDLNHLVSSINDDHDKEGFLMLLEDVPFDGGSRLFGLSALGELFRLLAESAFWEKESSFVPLPVSSDCKAKDVQHCNSESNMLHFESKHGIGKKLLVFPFVAKVRTHYYKKGGWKMRRCHVKDRSEKELEVEWGNNMGLIKYILTVPTAKGEEQLQAASLVVGEKLKEW